MVESNVRELIRARGVRMEDVIRDAGVPAVELIALFYGTDCPVRLNTLDALCAYFDCQPGELLQRYNGPRRKHDSWYPEVYEDVY